MSALEAAVRQGIVVDTIEVAARWSALAAIYRDAVAAARAVDGLYTVSAHQSHAYTDGACLYFTFAGQSPSGDGDHFYRQVWDAVTAATLANGGALSHHHGVGLNRGRYMRDALGPACRPGSRSPRLWGAHRLTNGDRCKTNSKRAACERLHHRHKPRPKRPASDAANHNAV